MPEPSPSAADAWRDVQLRFLRDLHSRAENGAPCKVCLVADGYAQCTTRGVVDLLIASVQNEHSSAVSGE